MKNKSGKKNYFYAKIHPIYEPKDINSRDLLKQEWLVEGGNLGIMKINKN